MIASGLFCLGADDNETVTETLTLADCFAVEPPVTVDDVQLEASTIEGPSWAEGAQKRRRGAVPRKEGAVMGVPFAPQFRMLKLIETCLRGYEWLHKPFWGLDAAQEAPVQPLAVGSQFGFWTVLEAPNPPSRRARWKCQCMCGTVRAVVGGNLLTGASRSCKCSKFSWTPSAKKKFRAAWEESRRASGLCHFCDNRAIEGCSRCSACLSKTMNRAKTRYNDRIANKQCPYCGEVPVANRKFCQKCLYQETAKVFNISVEEVARLRKLPCEVCGETERTVLDHDHATGATRGVLCNGCNAALGFVKENPETLQKLIIYIRRYSPQLLQSSEFKASDYGVEV